MKSSLWCDGRRWTFTGVLLVVQEGSDAIVVGVSTEEKRSVRCALVSMHYRCRCGLPGCLSGSIRESAWNPRAVGESHAFDERRIVFSRELTCDQASLELEARLVCVPMMSC